MNTQPEKLNSNDKSMSLLVLAGIVTIIVWQFPFGHLILYPFSLLGTWFHEMGHGLTALLLGGRFDYLEIFSNGSGLAYCVEGDWLFGERINDALVSLGGLIGPPIAGLIFIILGRKKWTSRIALAVFSVFMIASAIIWIRTLIGIVLIVVFGIVAGGIAIKAKARIQQFAIQFVGLQAFLSTYLGIDYLFMDSANIGGEQLTSDVGNIAQNLLLPYWIWGILISAFSVLLFVVAFKIAFRSKK